MDQLIVPLVSVFLSIIASVITASMWIGKYQNKIDNLETTVGKDDHAGIRKTVHEHSTKLASCETLLSERGPVTKRRSPVTLTIRGNSLLTESGGQKFVDDNIEELHNKVKEKSPATAYDIQEYSREVMDTLKNDARLNTAKDYLFKDGSDLNELVEVSAIYLRDKILEREKMTREDVDKKTPRP